MNMRITSPGPTLKWPGAKWTEQVIAPIVQHFPAHRCYVSLFFGSGGDLFNKAPAACEVVNDIVNFFEVLRDDQAALAEAVSLTPWSRREWELAQRRDDDISKLERARRFIARMNQSHGQRPGCTGWRHDGPARSSSFTLQWHALPARIVAAAERLRRVQIECRPALDILRRYAGADVLVFADPPYLAEVRKNRKIYRKELMSAAEHEDLLLGLRAHPGMGRAAGRLILSARRILRRRSGGRGRLRHAVVPLFIDSGAFTEVSTHGAWTWPAHDFAAFVVEVAGELGTVEHVGIQDWMCEPHIVALTGLSVEEHQRRTVASFIELRRLAPALPWVPTLQGMTVDDYMRCAQMYRDVGVDLDQHPLVGLGSVCRRSRSREIEAVIREVKAGLPERARLHGYGVKNENSLLACWGLASLDSMAWSRRARGLEANLRAALGLPVDAPSDQVLGATDEQIDVVDLDLVDFLAWKRDRCPRTAAASLEFAEAWRSRQLHALAARIVDELMAGPPAPAEAPEREQLALALPPAPPPTRPARPRADRPAAPGARPALAAHSAPHGPAQAALPLGGTPA